MITYIIAFSIYIISGVYVLKYTFERLEQTNVDEALFALILIAVISAYALLFNTLLSYFLGEYLLNWTLTMMN